MEGGMMMINVVTTLKSCSFTVDKNKPKPSFRQQPPQQQVSQLSQGNGPPDVVPGSASEAGIKDQSIQQLKGHLAASNSRFEAVAIVLQQTLTEVWKFLFMTEEVFYVWNVMDIIFFDWLEHIAQLLH